MKLRNLSIIFFIAGYGYKTQHSYPRSRLITWRRPEGEIWLERSEINNKNLQDEDKKSAIKNNTPIKKSYLKKKKRIPNKDNYKFGTDTSGGVG